MKCSKFGFHRCALFGHTDMCIVKPLSLPLSLSLYHLPTSFLIAGTSPLHYLHTFSYLTTVPWFSFAHIGTYVNCISLSLYLSISESLSISETGSSTGTLIFTKVGSLPYFCFDGIHAKQQQSVPHILHFHQINKCLTYLCTFFLDIKLMNCACSSTSLVCLFAISLYLSLGRSTHIRAWKDCLIAFALML